MNFRKLTQLQFDHVDERYHVTAFSCVDDLLKSDYDQVYHKEVIIEVVSKDRILLHFGGPITYNVFDIKDTVFDPKAPDLFCIDAAGRNHSTDKSVYIKTSVMRRLITIALNKTI